MCVLIFCTAFVRKSFSFKKNTARFYHKCIIYRDVMYIYHHVMCIYHHVMYIYHHVMCPLHVLSDFNKTRIFFYRFFENIKFSGNSSSRSRGFFSLGRTDGQADMMKLIVAFLNFANAPENWRLKICWDVVSCGLGLLGTEDGGTAPPRNFDNFLPVDEAQYSTKFAKTEHGPHSSKLFGICVVLLLFVLFCVLSLCKCVL